MANVPTANAKRFKINNIECGIWLNPIFSNEFGLKVTYKIEGQWLWLVEPSIFVSELTTKDKSNAVFKKALEEINQEIEKTLLSKASGDEPENGIERINYLIQQLSVTDNKLG